MSREITLKIILAMIIITFLVNPTIGIAHQESSKNQKDASDFSERDTDAGETVRQFPPSRSTNTRGADDWIMFCHDLNHSSTTSAQPPLSRDLLWSFDMNDMPTAVEGDIWSTPIIANNTVFSCSKNYYMVSIDIDTGAENWHTWLENTIASTPFYHDGNLYVGAGNKMWEVNADNGSKKIVFTTDSQIVSSPAIYNETIYFATMFSDSMFHAVSKNGTELWNISMNGSLQGTPGSPAVHNGTVYIGSDNGKFYALDHDGLLDGDQGSNTTENNTAADVLWVKEVGSSILASPTIIPGAVVFSTFNASGGNRIYAFEPDTGNEIWNYSVAVKVQSTAAYDGDTNCLYLGTFGGKMLALNATSGNLVWSFDIGGDSIQSSPAIADGMVFFGGFDRNIWALDAVGNGDGTTDEIWNYTTGGIIHSSPAISNGRLFIGSDDDKLYCVGTPDFSVASSDMVFSDISPYVGENITIQANVTNGGTVGSDVDAVMTAFNLNNSIKRDVGTIRLFVPAFSRIECSFDWIVEDNVNGLWYLRVELKNGSMNEPVAGNMAEKKLTFRRETEAQWPMSGGGPFNWNYNSRGTLTNRTLWEKDFSAELLSPIIYMDRTIIAEKNGKVRSLYLDQGGSSNWNIDLGTAAEHPPAAGYGKVFVPLKNKLVALDINGFEDGNHGIITETNTDIGDGDICWELDIHPDLTAPPKVANGTIYLVSDSNLRAVDEDDGAILFNVTMPGSTEGNAPAVYDDLVILGSKNGIIFAFNRFNGALEWDHDTLTGSPLVHSLSVVNDTVMCPAGDVLIAYNFKTHTIDWTIPTGSTINTSAAYSPVSDSIYFGTEGGKLHCVSRSQGQISMTYSAQSGITSDISLGGEVVFFADDNGRIYSISGETGNEEGKLRWSFGTDSIVSKHIAVSDLVVATNDQGNVYCFGAPNKVPIARISLPAEDTEVFAGDEIHVNASYSSDGDGDRLIFTWMSDIDGELHRGHDAAATIRMIAPGVHNLTLVVDDGQGGIAYDHMQLRVFQKRYIRHVWSDPKFNTTVSVKAAVGGYNASIVLNRTENPSNITGRDLGFFINVIGEGIVLTEWLNITAAYSHNGFPFGLNESYLSIYSYDVETGWMMMYGSIEMDDNRLWANVTELPDTYANKNTTVISVGTFHNTNPDLSSPSVAPMSGPEDGHFNFTVTYTDIDGDFPEEIVVVINGSDRFYMRPAVRNDLDVRDGKEYYYLLQGLAVGNHTYHFEANDRIIGTRTEMVSGLISLDTRPIALIKSPSDGSIFKAGEAVSFDATGSVDPDGDALNYTWVIEHLGGPSDGSNDRNFTTGKIITPYEFSTPGTYRITLQVADGFGHVSTPTSVTITVEPAPDGANGSDRSTMIYTGIIVLVVIVAAIGLIILLRRRGTGEDAEVEVDEEGAKEDATDESPPVETEDIGEEAPDASEKITDEEELVCIKCGSAVSSSDKSCSQCGEELMSEELGKIGTGEGDMAEESMLEPDTEVDDPEDEELLDEELEEELLDEDDDDDNDGAEDNDNNGHDTVDCNDLNGSAGNMDDATDDNDTGVSGKDVEGEADNGEIPVLEADTPNEED